MAIEAHKEEGIKEQGDPSSASLLAEVPPRDEVKALQGAGKHIPQGVIISNVIEGQLCCLCSGPMSDGDAEEYMVSKSSLSTVCQLLFQACGSEAL